MKRLCLLAALLLLGGFSSSLSAQNTRHGNFLAHMFPYLTPEQRTEVVLAYQKATADEPGLATDMMDLRKTGHELRTGNASPADWQIFRVKFLGYEERLRLAMVKQDAGVGPLLDEIDKHMPLLHPGLVNQ